MCIELFKNSIRKLSSARTCIALKTRISSKEMLGEINVIFEDDDDCESCADVSTKEM